jgi:hypothetical protein
LLAKEYEQSKQSKLQQQEKPIAGSADQTLATVDDGKEP